MACVKSKLEEFKWSLLILVLWVLSFFFLMSWVLTKFSDIINFTSDFFSFDIFYMHVPFSIFTLCFFWFLVMQTLLLWLGFPHYVFFVLRQCIFIISFFVSCISIVTGEFWSIATWGTWAPMDSSFLAQIFICFMNCFLFIFIKKCFVNNDRHFFFLSHFLIVFSFLQFPVVKYSVTWWNSLHMPSVFKPTYDTFMFFSIDFLCFFCVFLCFFFLMFCLCFFFSHRLVYCFVCKNF